jgi:hypothetical protein
LKYPSCICSRELYTSVSYQSFFVTGEEFEEADENQDLKIAELPLFVV